MGVPTADDTVPLTAQQQEWVQSVYRWCYVATGRFVKRYQCYHDFDEVLGEAFVGAMCAARRFDPKRGVKFASFANYWIFSAMQKWYRNRKRHVGGDCGYPIDELDVWMTTDPEVPVTWDAETWVRVRSLLTEKQTIAVIGRHVFGMTFQSLAEILGVTRSAVQQNLEKGLKKLRRIKLPGADLFQEQTC